MRYHCLRYGELTVKFLLQLPTETEIAIIQTIQYTGDLTKERLIKIQVN